jgi:hypothetical protein
LLTDFRVPVKSGVTAAVCEEGFGSSATAEVSACECRSQDGGEDEEGCGSLHVERRVGLNDWMKRTVFKTKAGALRKKEGKLYEKRRTIPRQRYRNFADALMAIY